MAAGGHSAYRGSLFWNITYEFQRAFSTEFNHQLPLSCVKKVRLVSKEKTEEFLWESRKPHVGSKAWLKVLGLFSKLSLSCNLFWLVI